MHENDKTSSKILNESTATPFPRTFDQTHEPMRVSDETKKPRETTETTKVPLRHSNIFRIGC